MTESCHTCGITSPESPSPFFCSDECQRVWHSRRALPALPERTVVPAQLAHLTHRWQAA